ncbi:MAG: S-layer homology domain-containing protein [Actinomycetia bacterium]|nr:S-layer homology domain-containing protein [Actinomycetes bacterium]
MRRYLPGVAAAVLAMVAAGVGVGSVEGVAVQNSRFSDVAADHYAAEAVERAAEVGVTRGYPDGTFRPQVALSPF